MEAKSFKSNYFLRALKGDYHPLTPNRLIMNEEHLEFRRRNWHLISEDAENLHFKNIIGVTVNKHLFGATITIKSSGNDPIIINGFWKKTANEIKQMCSRYIAMAGKSSESNYLKQNVSSTTGTEKKNMVQELKELKELLDAGVLSQEEFELAKRKILEE